MRQDLKKIMATMLAAVTLCAATALLQGCTSASPEYFTLDMRSSHTAKPVALQVGSVRVNEPLAQKNLLIKKSPTQVEYYAIGQWAGGLDEMLREKLEVEFGPHEPNAKVLVLTGDLLAFEQVDTEKGAEAHVKLATEIREEGTSRYSPALQQGTYEVSIPTEKPGANELATALSRCVEQIAAQIAADLSKP